MTVSRSQQAIWIPLLLALVLRLAMYPFAGISDPNTFEYGYIAEQLASGNGYSNIHWFEREEYIVPSAYMPPGQVLIIAGLFTTFGVDSQLAYHLLFLINVLLGVGAVFLIGEIARSLVRDTRIHLIALYAAALYPPFVFSASTWGVSNSVLFLNGLLVLSAMRLSDAIRHSEHVALRAMWFGFISGILILFRGEAPLTVLFIGLALLYLHRHRLAAAFKSLLIAATITVAIYSPWVIANYIRFDTIILGSTSAGYNLWRGNNPIASGGGWTAEKALVYPSRAQDSAMLKYLEAYPRDRWEILMSERYKHMAISWIEDHPGAAVSLMAKKAFLIWVVDWYHPEKTHIVYMIFQLLAVTFGAIGLMTHKRWSVTSEMRDWLFIVGGASLATTLVTMVFFSLPRYQIFLVGLYFPMVALGITEVLSRAFPTRFQEKQG